MEQNIKKEPPTEYLCILPAFRADKKLSGKQIVKSEDGEQSHSCKVCNRIYENEIKLKQHLNLHEKQVQCPKCLKLVSEAYMGKHLDLHKLKKQPPKFKCHICQRAFFVREDLLKHIKNHSRSFECDYCGVTRRQKSHFVDHLTKHVHPDKFKCQICPKMFSAINPLRQHFKYVHSERKFACGKCDKKFKNRSALKYHLKVHADRIKCHICLEMFSANSIANHTKVQHETKKREAKFRCHICARKFHLKSFLQNHFNAHIKPFKCNFCEKRFAIKTRLQDHLAAHAEPDIFKCKYCYKKLADNYCLRTHELRCQRGFYRCDQCPFEHRSRKELLWHVVKHKRQKNMSKCRGCYFVAETKLKLRNHRDKVHHGRYCAQCDQTFHTNANFEIHKSRHQRYSNQNLSAKCEICQRTFSTPKYKLKHIKQVHQRSEMCSCDLCGKIFMTKKTIKRHMINTHSSKPRERFKCDKCSKDYHSKQGLREHEASHGKKLSFKCHICSKSFATKNSLSKHLKIHSPEAKAILNCSRTNIIKCHNCDETFASQKTFENHLKIIHDEKTFPRTFICDKCGEKFSSQENILQHLKKQVEMRNSIRPLSVILESFE